MIPKMPQLGLKMTGYTRHPRMGDLLVLEAIWDRGGMGSRGQGAVPDTWNEVPLLPSATCEHHENKT